MRTQTIIVKVVYWSHLYLVSKTVLGFFSFWISLPQAKGRREREKERKRKGKETGKGKIGSEALAETENISYAPAWKRTRNPSKRIRSWSSTIEPPRQATSETSLFESLSVLPHLHNISIIQCSQLTNPLRWAVTGGHCKSRADCKNS